jgi:hypothetical protein
MQNVDELCIKYVLNELDPAEVLIVEQAMKEDSNVLIEIESLRSTLGKLEKLPEYTPPEPVREKILEKAGEMAVRRKKTFYNRIQWAGYLAAAIALIGFGFNYYGSTEQAVTVQESAASFTDQPVVQPHAETVQSSTPAAEPWVDRQNILHINISYGATGQPVLGTEGDITNAGTLRPVEAGSNSPSYPVMRDIQLTRTQR